MMTDTASHTADASPDAPGRFITIEGIDGAGKSTLAGMLADTLRQRGLEAVSTREPGGSPLAEKLRTLILERSRFSRPCEAAAFVVRRVSGRFASPPNNPFVGASGVAPRISSPAR